VPPRRTEHGQQNVMDIIMATAAAANNNNNNTNDFNNNYNAYI
jgi:uncharacterized membrane protein